jgi:hypothetical protein
MVGSTNAYITTNNGTSWTTSYSGTSSLYHIELKGNVTSAFGYAVGASGKVVKFVRQPATPTLTLTAPNGGEVWAIGASKNITWTSANVTNVAIKYSTDNGTNWMSVAASVPAATGTYAWTIPNTPSTQCKVRVSDASNDLLFDVSDAPFTISTQQIINAPMAMAEGWNMTSVPVVAANMTGSVLFSGANSQIFGYNNGYVTQTTLSNGVGYWVRYPAAANFTINGTAVAATTVPLVNGWNMVGVFHNNVPTANITTTPAGIINSFFFGFNNGYVQATTLESGKGYWVRTTQSGVMNVPGALLKDGQEGSTQYISQANNITISDAFGHSMILQVGRIANKEMSSYSLPPLPPEGVFDARFADNSCGKDISPAGETVLINSAEYPIMISASSEQFRIVDKTTGGKICNVIVSPEHPAIITNNAVHAIEILPISTPTQYSLEQNFPNPFNPTTSIRFHLASKETVRLTVINQLGQTVALLVNEEKEAGIYQIPFNAEGFASGIYYAVLKTERYSSGVKMILMK